MARGAREEMSWLSTRSVEPDVLWFCCVNQLASVYWPPKMFVTTVSIMVLVGPGPPTSTNKPMQRGTWTGPLFYPRQAGRQAVRESERVIVSRLLSSALRLSDFHDVTQSGSVRRQAGSR